MAFAPGRSGNPAGRRPGSRNKANVVAAEFANQGSELARVVMARALDGDMSAASLVLTRISPPLRARAERVQFAFDASKPLAEQAQQVVAACAGGEIDPETAQMLVGVIESLAGIRQVDDLTRRLQSLERQQR